MNTNQIINMIVRMVMRRVVRTGVNAGIDAISRRGTSGPPNPEKQQSPSMAETTKRAKQTIRMARRLR